MEITDFKSQLQQIVSDVGFSSVGITDPSKVDQSIKEKFRIPVLAIDFFIDPYQIALSKSYGSDCVLLIIAALNGLSLIHI